MKLHYPLSTTSNGIQDGSNLSSTTNYADSVMGIADSQYSTWARSTVGSLVATREALWPVLAPLGTVYTKGAFYFLVPVPSKVCLLPIMLKWKFCCSSSNQMNTIFFICLTVSFFVLFAFLTAVRRRSGGYFSSSIWCVAHVRYTLRGT